MRGAFLLVALLAVDAAAYRPVASRESVQPKARFKTAVPSTWVEVVQGEGELGAGAWGAVFQSSRGARGGEAARIIVVFYAPGNPHFKDAADYIARQTAPVPVTPAGEKTGPVTERRLGLLAAKTFTRSRRAVQETVTAADAPGGGFYAVTCSAPAVAWKTDGVHFEKALSAFSFLPPPPPAPGP